MATFHEILERAGRRARLVLTGAAGADSTTTSLDTGTLRNVAIDDDRFDGAFILLDGPVQRAVQIRGYEPSSGGLKPVEPFGAAPDTGDDFGLFLALPAYPGAGLGWSWADALNEALEYCYVEKSFRIGEDDEPDAYEFDIPADEMGDLTMGAWPRHIASAELRDTGYSRHQNLSKNGYRWQVEAGKLRLNYRVWPSTTRQIWLRATVPSRHDYTWDTREEEVELEEDRAVAACLWRVYYALNGSIGAGKWAGELESARADFERLDMRYKPRPTIRGA